MNDPDAELDYLQRAGFSRPQAEAIIAAKSMASRGYPEQTIRLTLVKRGFSADQAGVIAKAALKETPGPQRGQPAVRVDRSMEGGSSSRGQRMLRVFLWIVVLAIIRWFFLYRR